MRLKAGLVISLSCVVLALAIRLGAEGQQPPPAGAPPQGQPPAGAPGAPGGGQRPGGPAPAPTNLKVLPKEWTRMQVQTLMQTFVTSLGQQATPGATPTPGVGEGCLHCHVATPPPAGGGRGGTDYAADTNPNKDIARTMIQMVMQINTTTKDVGDKAVVEKISCWSCHQGKSKPALLPENGWGRGSFSLLPAGPPPAGGPGRGAH